MTRRGRGFLLATALCSSGCLVPQMLTTTTEVVTAKDAAPVFGPTAEMRALDSAVVLDWDKAAGAYKAREGFPQGLRVARFKGDVYLFQTDGDSREEGYLLLLARVSREGDATPLSCAVTEAKAADFGVRIQRSSSISVVGEMGMGLRGERAGILGLLASVLPSCTPTLRFAHWTPASGELASSAATPGALGTPGCLSCPQGACVQGSVTDQSGAALPGTTVRVEPGPGSGSDRSDRSDEDGTFLVSGLAPGSYTVTLELSGFRRTSSPSFAVSASTTYLFESPFELTVGPYDATPSTSAPPIPCRSGRTPKR